MLRPECLCHHVGSSLSMLDYVKTLNPRVDYVLFGISSVSCEAVENSDSLL